MPRNPELDQLLREVDSLTGGGRAPEPQPVEPQPVAPRRGESSFLKTIGGFFVSRVDEEDDEATVIRPVAPPPPPVPPTVSQMAAATPRPTFATAPPDAGEDLSSIDFVAIYQEAGIDEAVFTVDKLATLLQDPMLKDQPLSAKTLVLKMALKAQNVSPEVPVQDAVSRDRALDGYQAMLNQRARETATANEQLVQQINEEVRAFLERKNAEMDTLRTETQEMKRQAEAFAARRRQEEQRLAEIIVPLLEGQPNPVSIGNQVGE
jgi:hypothetical protein